MKEFKLIVAGSRSFKDVDLFVRELNRLVDHDLDKCAVSIVSGMSRGADAMGYHFAKSNGIQCYEFPAHWDILGKSAGYIRNEEMGKFADGLLAFWDGKSPGTKHMIEFMKAQRKPFHVVQY